MENDRIPPAVSTANAVHGSSITALENCLVVGGTQAKGGSPSAPLSPARAAGARTGNSTVTMVLQGVSTESAVEVGTQQKQQRQAPRRSVHGYEVRWALKRAEDVPPHSRPRCPAPLAGLRLRHISWPLLPMAPACPPCPVPPCTSGPLLLTTGSRWRPCNSGCLTHSLLPLLTSLMLPGSALPSLSHPGPLTIVEATRIKANC